MAITFVEVEENLSGEAGSRVGSDVPYVGTGGGASDTEAEALAALAGAVASTRGGKTLDAIRVASTGGGTWTGTAVYRDAAYAVTAGAKSFAFNISAGTKHVRDSLETIESHAPTGKTPPDFHGAINVTADGAGGFTVGGTEAFVPESEWEETIWMADSDVTSAYKALLRSMVGTVCNAPFKGDDTHECVFVGAQGSRAPGSLWQITFRFRSSPNVVIPKERYGVNEDVNKDGWEFLWVYYGPDIDAASASTVVKPVAVYVEVIYEEADFSLFGIGTT